MTSEVRVLHLITRFLRGGAETTTRNTLEALLEAEEPYDLRLGYGAGYDEYHVQEVRELGVETVCFRSIRHYNPFTALFAVFAVTLYLWREDVDVLHTHSTEAGIIGRFAGWLARTPVVIHEVHGDPIAEDRNFVLNRVLVWLERLTARVSTRIIVKAHAIRDTYLDRGIGGPDQYELIYHGVDLDIFRDVGPGEPVNNKYTTLLFVGRLEDGKGLFDLLDVFERLEDEYPVELWIVGDGVLMEDLKQEVSDKDLKGIQFLGYKDDVPGLMAAADVFVLPSYREGTPRVITEALASGLPVVSTDIAGIPEQVRDGETGYLIEPGNLDDLEQKLEQLVSSNETRSGMTKEAQETVGRFSVSSAKEKYAELYGELTGSDDGQ